MVEIYDLETYKNVFIYCYVDRDTLKKGHFEISFRKDDTQKILDHLKIIKGQIGFNNIEFDWVVLDWLINNYEFYNQYSLPQAIYNKVQELFDTEGYKGIRNPLVPQLDLYRIWHYSNKSRATSLKWLEFAMRMQNIEDLPYKIDEELTSEMIDEIIEYCYHDVEATRQFYLKSLDKIELRKKLQQKYGLNLINRPDVGMAEDLVLDSYCKSTGLDKNYVRGLKSIHSFIQANDIILPQIKFQTEYMKNWFEKFKSVYLLTPRGNWKGQTIELFDEKYDVGLGGLHIEQKALEFYKTENTFLAELDCSGMYPTFIAKHGMYPAHLGKDFLMLYRQIRDDRMEAKRIGDKTMDAAGKLMGNGVFGKFGSDLSYLFDLKMLYTTTLNNQLFLLMLIEQCGLNNLKIISANTDSITINIDNSKKPLLESIVDSWEKVSLHTLEYTPYNCIIYRDVNNYISQTIEGKIKTKGCFEKDRDFHKNHSMMIIPIALEKYYIDGIPVETTIKNHNDIFDFCKAVKGNKSIKYKNKLWKNNEWVETKLQTRVNRYIIVNNGSKLIKIMKPLENEDGSQKKDKLQKYRKENPHQLDLFHFIDDVVIQKNRESEVESGFFTQIMNRIESLNVQDYDINYEYYINECYKIINQIQK